MGKEYRRTILAASPVVNVPPLVFYDDFENLLRWIHGGTSGDYTFELSSADAFRGSKSLLMTTPATNPVPGQRAVADIITAISSSSKMYIRFYSKVYGDKTKASGISALFDVYNGFGHCGFGFATDQSLGKTYLLADTGFSFEALSPDPVLPSEEWSLFQISVNLETGKYDKLIISGREIDISDYDIYKDATSTDPGSFHASLEVDTVATEAVGLYIDDFAVLEDIW